MQLKQQIDQLSTAEQLLLVEQIWNNIDKAQIELSAEHKEILDKMLENDFIVLIGDFKS